MLLQRSLAVCSWLCWVAVAIPAGAVWIKPASFRSLRASFRRPLWVSSSVWWLLAVWAALFRLLARESACSSWAMASSISSTLPLASWFCALTSMPFPARTAPQPSVLSSKPSPFSPRFSRLESTMWPRLSWDFW